MFLGLPVFLGFTGFSVFRVFRVFRAFGRFQRVTPGQLNLNRVVGLNLPLEATLMVSKGTGGRRS